MWSWITFILVIIAFIIVFKIIKSLIKTLLIFSVITIIILGVFTYLAYSNMETFKDNFPESKKLLVLEEEGDIIVATVVEKLDFGNDEMPIGFTEDELLQINKEYEESGIEGIKHDNFLVLKVTPELFMKGVGENVSIYQDLNISKDEFVKAFSDDAPSELLIQKILEKKNIVGSDEYKSDVRQDIFGNSTEEDIKSMFLLIGISDVFQKNEIAFVAKQIKKDNFVIYPDFIMFSVVKYIPDFAIDRFVKEK